MYELLSRATIPFSCVSYSHTVYGRSAVQHELCKKVLKSLNSKSCKHHHKLWIMDDLLDSPVLQNIGKQIGVKSPGETPATLFSALPIMLYYRYTSIAIGNERSSNVGNLTWGPTSEDINHQWGKSEEAEFVFSEYIQHALITNVPYFSVLQPLYDALIFSVAASRVEAAMYTHSCNIIKPWCKRCPKCCYVWLMFMTMAQSALGCKNRDRGRGL